MADFVNMQKEEYDAVLSKLIAVHKEETDSIDKIVRLLRSLCEKDGGFYVKNISGKINMMLNSVDSYILAVLDENFEASQLAMETFMVAIKETDRR